MKQRQVEAPIDAHQLRLCAPDNTFTALTLAVGEQILVGRGRTVHVRLPDNELSRRHCRFRATRDGLYCEDLGSSNGTWLNDKAINRARLVVGDRVALGGYRVEYIATPLTVEQRPLESRCMMCDSPYDEGRRIRQEHRDLAAHFSAVCPSCDRDELKRQDQIHGFELLGLLGAGSMARVYKAKDASGQTVAVKILKLSGEPDAFERFVREARLAKSLSHPNVVETIGLGESSGRLYLIHEYVPGPSLSELVEARGPLERTVILSMAKRLLEVLEVAGAEGIVHRDLKPGNILIAPNGEPKVSDFGLARLVRTASRSGLTTTGDLLGTPMFMPPEQFVNAAKVDHRADLYALGVTLYYLTTGNYPYQAQSIAELCEQLRKGAARDVRVFRPRAPAELCRFIGGLMTPSIERRFQSAQAASLALEAVRASAG